MKKKYISLGNMPPRFPITFSVAGWLLLDRLDAAGWVHGVFWTFVALAVMATLIQAFTQEPVDINKS